MRRPAKIAVIYVNGHVRTLAEKMAEEVKASGAECTLLQIPEILSEDVRGKLHAAPRAEYPDVTADMLKDYDGFLFGFPTRYGRATAAVSAFFDTTGGLWFTGALVGKFAGVFTSTASQHGGQETTALTTIPFFVHQGISFVPCPYTVPELQDNSEVVGGGPYGAGAIANGDGSRQVSEKEFTIAKHQARHFSKIVSQFVAGAAVLAKKEAGTGEAVAVAGGAPVLAKAVPATGQEPGYTVDSTEGEREAAAPKEPAPPAAESEVPVAAGDAPVTEEAAPAAAPEESAPPVGAAGAEQSEQPKREEAPQKKEEPKKKGGLFASCCGGSSKNYD
ncbi:hypothetical protein JCM8202v2_003352 [Rhodotorula sphaerocarpa]